MTGTSTALIVGASRGLGLATADEYIRRGWHVIATERGAGTRTGLRELRDKAGRSLEIEHVDINLPDQVAALRRRLDGRRIDLLFVNAGVANDRHATVGEVTTEEFVRVMVTNALSPMRVIETLQDLVPAGGTIGVMSSGLGSVANNTSGGWEVYRGSKAALNTLMRSFAARDAAKNRSLVIVAPGWVRTDMGGPSAALDVRDSIPGVVDAISSRSGKPGAHYLDYRGQAVPW